MNKTTYSILCRYSLLFFVLVTAKGPEALAASDALIRHVMIEPATKETPRSDTASVIELADGRLMVVYHKYEQGKRSGHDDGLRRVWSKTSSDGGKNWSQARKLVDVKTGDISVGIPALLRLKTGRLLLSSLRFHKNKHHRAWGSTMELYTSNDEGQTFHALSNVWDRPKQRLLQGGASSIVKLKSGRLLMPCHGGKGFKITAWCFRSDDQGKTWQRSNAIDLPKRGAMEGSVVELADGQLLMSLRTQLGGPYLSRSSDGGKTWSNAVFSGLEGGESCTCLRRVPGTGDIVLFWNNSKYKKRHHHLGERTPLTAAISSDSGKTWRIIGNIADDPKAEYTNLDCYFTSKGNAVLTYMYAKPAWNRKQMDLKAALISKAWFGKKESSNKTE